MSCGGGYRLGCERPVRECRLSVRDARYRDRGRRQSGEYSGLSAASVART